MMQKRIQAGYLQAQMIALNEGVLALASAATKAFNEGETKEAALTILEAVAAHKLLMDMVSDVDVRDCVLSYCGPEQIDRVMVVIARAEPRLPELVRIASKIFDKDEESLLKIVLVGDPGETVAHGTHLRSVEVN